MKSNAYLVGRGARRSESKEKFWREAVEQFAASGQTVRAFCRRRRLGEASFYAWRRTLKQRQARGDAFTDSSAAAFVPVHVTDPQLALRPGIEVMLRNGRRLRLRGAVDRELLAETVAVLESLPVADPGAR